MASRKTRSAESATNKQLSLKRLARPAFLILATLLASPPAAFATKYKKSTVVDFEGALVEGKSRKPYSAYLTQQKDSAFGELHQWQPDLDKSLEDSQTRLGNK